MSHSARGRTPASLLFVRNATLGVGASFTM
jgi:hypothetical protein